MHQYDSMTNLTRQRESLLAEAFLLELMYKSETIHLASPIPGHVWQNLSEMIKHGI